MDGDMGVLQVSTIAPGPFFRLHEALASCWGTITKNDVATTAPAIADIGDLGDVNDMHFDTTGTEVKNILGVSERQ